MNKIDDLLEMAAAAKARADEATPGPWECVTRACDDIVNSNTGCDVIGPPDAMRGQFASKADAEFIAAARQDVPALVDAVLDMAEDILVMTEDLVGFRELLRIFLSRLDHVGASIDSKKRYCSVCGATWPYDGEERHETGCAWVQAEALCSDEKVNFLADLQQAWKDAVEGDTQPIEELWEGIEE